MHVPLLSSRQILVNISPGRISVSSGMVTSIGSPAAARSQTNVPVGVIRFLVGLGVIARGVPWVGVLVPGWSAVGVGVVMAGAVVL